MITTVFAHVSDVMMAGLAEAFGDEPLPADDLLQRAWPVLRRPEHERAFTLGFQLFGRAAAGHEPHAAIATNLMTGWLHWLTQLIDAPTPARRRRDAMAIITLVEGTFLMRAFGLDPALTFRAATTTSPAPRPG